MPAAPAIRAVQLVTEGRAPDAVALAQALREQAAHLPDGDADPAAVTEHLTTSLVEVLALMGARSPDALARAHAFIDEARAAGRPAWSAAGRAVAARIARWSGTPSDVLAMLALAELELADELESGLVLDPPGGPTGPGAAANNLGAIYDDLGLMDRALHHLQAAARASTDHYGGMWRDQACVDRVNLLAFWLSRALDSEADGDLDRAEREARLGLREVDEIAALGHDVGWSSLLDWARILGLGCESVADPASTSDAMRDEVQAIIDRSTSGSLVRNVTAYLVLARLCRLCGDAHGAVEAAAQAAQHTVGSTNLDLSRVWREAGLAVAAPDSPAFAYAHSMRARLREYRDDLATSLDQRIEMLKLERRHAEVREARERLETALAEAEVAEAGLRKAASRDHLTGLLNRSTFEDLVARALDLARGGRGFLAVVFIDLDGFKRVNDERGHAAGDRLLVTIADRLRSVVRDSDALARYGGDEFVCLRRNARDGRDLQRWADRLRSAVAEASTAFDPSVPVSASIGLFLVEDPSGWTPAGVLAQADAAMYAAKRRGPGRVHTAGSTEGT